MGIQLVKISRTSPIECRRITHGDTTHMTTSNSSITSRQEGPNNGNIIWSRAHLNVQFYQYSHFCKVILLDSESSTSIVCNLKFVTDIHKQMKNCSYQPMAIHLKPRQKQQFQESELYGMILIWLLIYLHWQKTKDGNRITYDLAEELALIMHIPDKQVRFSRSFGKLYCYKPIYFTGTDNNGGKRKTLH